MRQFNVISLISFLFIVLLGGYGSPATAVAASWKPTKPIILVVPWPPGGGTDFGSRKVAAGMKKYLGVPVIIKNIPGASSDIGITRVWHAKPDGYTLLTGQPHVMNTWVLATPLLLLMMAAFGLGLGVIISALTTRYRDLAVLVSFGVQLFMYASPIVYPLSVIPQKWHFWASLNPIAPIVELFRHAYLGAGTVDLPMLGISAITITAILFLGIVLFNRVERTFMDTV